MTLWVALLSLWAVPGALAGSIGTPPTYLERGDMLGAAEWAVDRREVNFDTRSNKYLLGMYYGLSSWASVGIIAGASDLSIDFGIPGSENYEDNINFGAGLGARLDFIRFGKGSAGLFLSGNAFGFRSEAEVDVRRKLGIITLDERQTRSHTWIDWQGMLGLSLGEEPFRAYGGVGIGGTTGRLKVKHYLLSDGAITNAPYAVSEEDFRTSGAAFGCFGIDIPLPDGYSFYAEVRAGNTKDISFSVGIAQISKVKERRTP